MLLEYMLEKTEAQRLTDFQVKMRPELFIKYENQSREAGTVTELVQILASIEASKAYMRTLSTRSTHLKDNALPDLGGKRSRNPSGPQPPAKRFKENVNTLPLGPRDDPDRPQRVC